MASSSTSSIHKNFKYDVFLSFRGDDTRKNFVDHLYTALQHKSIHTYKDDERIKKGKRISDELIRAIEDSKFYIIVFSKNYASSSWCLDELVKIMECQKTPGHTAYPVFFDVEPTEVRKQSGFVGEAFARHEKEAAAGKWRDALKEAADLSGWELKKTFDGHEAKLIHKMVEEISLELGFINSSIDGKLVGMETRVKKVVSSLETGIDDVRMIGIKGMGGAGKTTLARSVFDHISIWFDGSIFVENVRERTSLYGLHKLQKQILSNVLNDQSIKISGVYDGKNMMRKMLCSRKVLVVLDDVDHIDQLEALAGEGNWFKPGSRIIITTREEQVLIAHQANFVHDVHLLVDEEAICLFSRYAFGKETPIQGYKELSRQVVRYAAGLPLTIKVLGSFLRGQGDLEWKDALERLKKIPLKGTLDKLELSYNGLEEDYKEIFLDVACILKGWKKDEAIIALESCGFYARNGLRVLEQKSLITISEYGTLGMHDHIEEMGKNIVRRLHPNEPHKHSRLWIKEEIEYILVNDLGTEAIRYITLSNRKLHPAIVMKGLGSMKELRFLYVRDDMSFMFQKSTEISQDIPDEVSQYILRSLLFLCWHGYRLACLPKSLIADNLVGLEMPYSSIIQLWEGQERKVLNKLRFIDLRYSKLRTLDLRLFPNLETLDLLGCDDLVELNMHSGCQNPRFLKLNNARGLGIGCTSNLKTLSLANCEELHSREKYVMLKYLNLSDCKLRTLDLAQTLNLKKLVIENCENLVELHMPVESLKLEYLKLSNCKLRTLNLACAPNLERLVLLNCGDLVELHMPVESPKLESLDLYNCKLRILQLVQTTNLKMLDLKYCEDLFELHLPVESPKLESLNISNCKLRTLDLASAPNLELLVLENCKDLIALHMPVESLMLKSLDIYNCKLKTLDLSQTLNLKVLDLKNYDDLVELCMPVESPTLELLNLYKCKLRILDLLQTPNLMILDLKNCEDLVVLHMPVESPKLISLDISNCMLRTLDLAQAPNLDMLVLKNCEDLVELHMPAESRKLKSLDISNCKLRTLDLARAPNLEMLVLKNCEDLVEPHMRAKNSKLESLHFYNCKIRILHLEHTLNLKTLDLKNCEDLVELHMPIESTKLVSLSIFNCKLRTLDIAQAPNLELLVLKNCEELVELHMPVESLKLESLNLYNCKLRILHLVQTPNLKTLDLKNFEDLVELHMSVESPKLESLNISKSRLRTLDLGQAPNLELLVLKNCKDLVKLYMSVENPKLESLDISNCKLRTLDLGLTPNLKKLNLIDCYNLEDIQAPVGCLTKLVRFKLSGCIGFRLAWDYRISSVVELCLTAESLDICPLHPNNHLPKLRFKCIYKAYLPSSNGNLEKIISFGMCACKNLERFSGGICGVRGLRKLTLEGSIPEIPKDLGQLESLVELRLSCTKQIEYLPDSICLLKHLKFLRLESCWLLEHLPDDLGRLESLEELHLTECIFLRDIPNSICEMKRLKYLHLPFCILVDKLPEEIGRLECLKEINIGGTGIAQLPNSIFGLKGLLIIGTKWRLESYGFTSMREYTEYMFYCYI